ncbi:hypothetical protein Tco_1262910 [Tanacetum coccineum]
MGRDIIQLEDAVSIISQEYLLEFISEYGIPESLHPELPGREEPIVEFPEGKVSVYTKFFEFANFRIPISQFLFDILGYYQIHPLQLSVIGAAKMSFSKRQGKNTPQCYTKPIDSLKNWNNRFFWVDERIFPTVVKWRTNAPKDGMPPADSYSAVDVTTLNTHRAATDCHCKPCDRYGGHERGVRILRDTLRPRDGTEDQVQDGLSHEILPTENPTTTEAILEPELEKEVAAMGPLVNERRRKRGNDEADANAPPKVLRKDHAAFRPAQSTLRGKSLALMGLEASSTFLTPATQEAPADAKSMSDPDLLSYANPQPHLERDSSRKTAIEIPIENIATTEVLGEIFTESPESGKSASFSSVDGSPRGIYQPEWGMTNNCRLDTPDACQDMVDHIVPPGYFSELRHLPNTHFLSKYNINLARKVAMGSQLRLRFEQEVKLLKKAKAKIARQD